MLAARGHLSTHHYVTDISNVTLTLLLEPEVFSKMSTPSPSYTWSRFFLNYSPVEYICWTNSFNRRGFSWPQIPCVGTQNMWALHVNININTGPVMCRIWYANQMITIAYITNKKEQNITRQSPWLICVLRIKQM
jgi:hypothetical protein